MGSRRFGRTGRLGRRTAAGAVAVAALVGGLAPVGPATAVPPAPVEVAVAAEVPAPDDPFYVYDGTTPLADLAPGAVLDTRAVRYSLAGLPLPVDVVQILFRTTDQQGRAVAGVTSVLKPASGRSDKVVSYESFYDSLNPEDGPSRSVTGGTSIGGLAVHFESALMAPLLLQGYAVVMTDIQGPTADFAAGPEYGQVSLDGIRAALAEPRTGIAPSAKVGLIGYSGGAIGANWAAVLAPSYAPDVDARLVGAAEGGLLVDPAANLEYVGGSSTWAGVIPMAIIGVARAFGIDLRSYLNDYGREVFDDLQDAPISAVLGQYRGLTWQKMAKPAYANPASVPEYVEAANQLNLGSRPSPTVPMFIGQGTVGELEGTSGGKAGIGRGDGVMIAGDVRTLARQYCADGTKVLHREYPLSHFSAMPFWVVEAVGWLKDRFAGKPAPENCARIPAGNPLTPLVPVAPAS